MVKSLLRPSGLTSWSLTPPVTRSIATNPWWDVYCKLALDILSNFPNSFVVPILIFQDGEKHCESRVSWPGTQNNYTARS